MAAVLQKSAIIILDECNMAHKHSLNAFYRSMQLLMSGDFWQTLPVIPSSTFADEINAYLEQSFLWRSIETLRTCEYNCKMIYWRKYFLSNCWILKTVKWNCIKIHQIVCTDVEIKSDLIESVFPDVLNNYLDHN